MNVILVIFLALIIIAGLVIFKLTKSVVKVLFLVSSLLSLAGIIIGVFVVTDSLNFKNHIAAQPSILLLNNQGNIIAGFSAILGEDFNPSFFSSEQLKSYENSYKQENFEEIIGENYKLFLFEKSSLDTVKVIKGETSEGDIQKQDFDKLLDSDTSIEDYIKMQNKDISSSQLQKAKQDFTKQMNITNDEEFKGLLFGSLFSSALQQEGQIFLFDHLKQGDIIIYPETAMFKFIKIIPLSLIKNTITIERGDQNINNG